MKFRMTIGENGTPWGKQLTCIIDEAENALQFAQKWCDDLGYEAIKNCWIDAGEDTLPIAVCNLKLRK